MFVRLVGFLNLKFGLKTSFIMSEHIGKYVLQEIRNNKGNVEFYFPLCTCIRCFLTQIDYHILLLETTRKSSNEPNSKLYPYFSKIKTSTVPYD